jgi:hypothetical protein
MLFDINRGVSGRWRCKKRATHRAIERTVTGREFEIAVADGTWFSNTKLSIENALLLTYCWSEGLSYEQTMRQCRFDEERLSKETVADWYSYCREVSMIALDTTYARKGTLLITCASSCGGG